MQLTTWHNVESKRSAVSSLVHVGLVGLVHVRLVRLVHVRPRQNVIDNSEKKVSERFQSSAHWLDDKNDCMVLILSSIWYCVQFMVLCAVSPSLKYHQASQ